MERALRWKTIFLVAIVVLSVVYLLPSALPDDSLPSWFSRVFTKKVKLGLALRGGFHIVYRVDLDKVIDDKAGEIKRDMEAKLAEQKLDTRVETPRANPTTAIPLGA